MEKVRTQVASYGSDAAKRVHCGVALFILSLFCAGTCALNCHAGEARYRVIKIIEGDGINIPEAGGINQKGQVVGSVDVRGHPNFWLWSDGERQDLPLGNGKAGLAAGINNQGQVVGSFLTGEFIDDGWGNLGPVYHAFVRTDGSLQDLGTIGGWTSFGVWINDQGVVVGSSDNAENNDRLPCIAWDGQIRSLWSLISNPSGWRLELETHYVAADGRIWGLATRLGMQGKYYIYEMTPEGDGMYQIRSRGTIETIDVVKILAFNEYGQAVGFTRVSAFEGPAFFWDGQETVFLDSPGQSRSFPYAVNNLGQVVGMRSFDTPSRNAFLWEDGVMSNLNDLIPSDSGVLLTKAGANSINDAGEIVCTYRNMTNGFFGVCLLEPVIFMPLEITHHELTPDGLRLEVRGGDGQPVAVEYTSDWAQWTPLATSTNLYGRRKFIDPSAPDAGFRAYRARLLAP